MSKNVEEQVVINFKLSVSYTTRTVIVRQMTTFSAQAITQVLEKSKIFVHSMQS